MALSKENNNILPKDVKKRLYKSRKQRPCDNCRKRKSCCIIEDGIPCKLCKMFNKQCTFEKGPVYTTTKFPFKKMMKKQQQLQLQQQQSFIQSIRAQAGLSSASSLNFQPIMGNPRASAESNALVGVSTYNNTQSQTQNITTTSSSTPETPSLYNDQRSNSAGIELSADYYNDLTFPSANDSIDLYLNTSDISTAINRDLAVHHQSGQYPLQQQHLQSLDQDSIHDQTCEEHEEGLDELWDMPFDLNMNLDALNFQAGFFDNLNIDLEQLMG